MNPPPSIESVDKKSGRKVWDKQYYEKRADERGEDLPLAAERKQLVAPPIAERVSLRQREEAESDLSAKLGKTQVVTAFSTKEHQGGFYCKVCDSLIKDSASWLDHLNGKKHNHMLGMSMTVERCDATSVRDRLAKLATAATKRSQLDDVDYAEVHVEQIQERLMALEEKDALKKKRKRRKKEDDVVVKKEELVLSPEDDTMRQMGLPTVFASSL